MSLRPDNDSTGILLALVQKHAVEEKDWRAFVERYRPIILAWCLHWGLQDADAHDVTQDVFVKLLAKMRDFRYDPNRSFRAWLKTVVQHMILDFLSQQNRERGTGDSAVLRLLNQLEARDDLIAKLETVFDQELMQIAIQRVRARVEPHTWEAFRLLHFERLSGIETARQLGRPVAHVFVAKRRVLRMLQEEIRRLEGPSGEGAANATRSILPK